MAAIAKIIFPVKSTAALVIGSICENNVCKFLMNPAVVARSKKLMLAEIKNNMERSTKIINLTKYLYLCIIKPQFYYFCYPYKISGIFTLFLYINYPNYPSP